MNEVEEISLYELILMIIKGWRTIILITIILILLSVGVFIFFNKPTYVTQTSASLTFNQVQYTDIGEYTFPYTKPEEFITILKNEEFIEYIASETNLEQLMLVNSVTYNVKNSNEINISVSNSNKEMSSKILNIIKENSESFLNYYLSNEAINKLKLSKTIKLKSLNKNLLDLNRIISYLENKLLETKIYLGNNINPEYSSIVNVLEIRKTDKKVLEFNINDLEEDIKLIDEFNSSIISFNDYLNSDSDLLISKLEMNFKDNKSNETYQFNAKTLFPISGLLGIMLGVFIVFFKSYWHTNSQIHSISNI